MNELYLVITQEVFAGDEDKFFTEAKLFTTREKAENYFRRVDNKFRQFHSSVNEDGEATYDFDDETHGDWRREYFWHGTSHHRSEIRAIMPE